MRVLVVGSGAREHAIAWKLRQSARLSHLFVAPGNAGTASIAENLPTSASDMEGLARTAREHQVDLTIVGPEAPLAQGIVDLFRAQGLAVFGPTKAAARIEASKVFSKSLMQRHGIPTAAAQVFSSYEAARRYVMKHELPLVVKADGLAAGKGVFVCHTQEEALEALHECMEARAFGLAGDQVLVEECLQGREVSVFSFTDGTHLSPLVAACDYKRVGDGERGPNTGGMGSYSPPEFWTARLAEQVRVTIMEPTVRAMAQEGYPYQGVLYAGLMMTQEGPKVIEFNCRLGDPETQALLPRLKTDLLELCLAVLDGRLQELPVKWSPEACVGVVMASQGYPGNYPRGVSIQGLERGDKDGVVFHAGTKPAAAGQVVTDGGRVLTVTALGATLEEARQRVYRNVERISFEGAHYRRDIAALTQATV